MGLIAGTRLFPPTLRHVFLEGCIGCKVSGSRGPTEVCLFGGGGLGVWVKDPLQTLVEKFTL